MDAQRYDIFPATSRLHALDLGSKIIPENSLARTLAGECFPAQLRTELFRKRSDGEAFIRAHCGPVVAQVPLSEPHLFNSGISQAETAAIRRVFEEVQFQSYARTDSESRDRNVERQYQMYWEELKDLIAYDCNLQLRGYFPVLATKGRTFHYAHDIITHQENFSLHTYNSLEHPVERTATLPRVFPERCYQRGQIYVVKLQLSSNVPPLYVRKIPFDPQKAPWDLMAELHSEFAGWMKLQKLDCALDTLNKRMVTARHRFQ